MSAMRLRQARICEGDGDLYVRFWSKEAEMLRGTLDRYTRTRGHVRVLEEISEIVRVLFPYRISWPMNVDVPSAGPLILDCHA